MKVHFLFIYLLFFLSPFSAKPLCHLEGEGKSMFPVKKDTAQNGSSGSLPSKSINIQHVKNGFAKNILGYLINVQDTTISRTGVKSISYFEQFSGKRIASIRFIRLHPFGTSINDTTLDATRWIEKAGNRLHMNTARSKLRMQVLFKSGDLVNPLLIAENEKLMRDLSYLEDVTFRLEPAIGSPDLVNVIIISKDKFEYGINASADESNSNLEVVNENMFGLGHRFSIGMAQKNAYLPEMGIYSAYRIDNFLGKFISMTVGFTDTYLKKGWNLSAEKRFLTSSDENAGGISFDHVSKYNFIADDHPIKLDTTISYISSDLWFAHAFSDKDNLSHKTLLSFRYYHQEYFGDTDEPADKSMFFRNHDFFLASVGFSRRNLYKNNLVYGYGVTEDIPYGHFFELKGGLDKSQLGVWPYLGVSLSNAILGNKGGYFCGKLSLDGFMNQGSVSQGTFMVSGNFFSKKMYAFGDPFRQFINLEFLSGINRFKEEYLTIDGRFGIRDFYTNDLKGNCRLKLNLEMVRYLRWNLYGFRFTNYIFSDIAFLSDQAKSIFKEDFYAGIGTGFRIFNESLVFKIVDIRLTWFPVRPPEGRIPFGANLQGLTKSTFDDFLGRKSEIIRYQ